MASIAKAARVNNHALYYHFGNKSALFRAVLEDALEAQFLGNAVAVDDVPSLERTSWLVEMGELVLRNHENTGPTPAQKLLIESYYASWRSEGAAEKLLPRLQQHVDLRHHRAAERAGGEPVDRGLRRPPTRLARWCETS